MGVKKRENFLSEKRKKKSTIMSQQIDVISIDNQLCVVIAYIFVGYYEEK